MIPFWLLISLKSVCCVVSQNIDKYRASSPSPHMVLTGSSSSPQGHWIDGPPDSWLTWMLRSEGSVGKGCRVREMLLAGSPVTALSNALLT